MRQMQAGGGKAMSFGKSRARLLTENQQKVTFEDVAGIDEAKEELEEIIEFLKDPKKFTRLGGRIPKGVLLVGLPGTGKTLLARAIAGEAGVPFFTISGSDFVEMFVGVGASRVRDLFIQGKKHAPCIIFIDEIDAVGRHRGAGLGGGHDEREQTLNQLLVEMDGFETNEGVILISATNRPDVLDPALLRPGRFDRQVVVPKPDIKGRLGILRVHTRKMPLDGDVDLEVLARGTPGFSGADLENLVNEAALLAARVDKQYIGTKDFEMAKDKVMMGVERKSMIISDEERRNTAYHEAGHALVACLLPGTDPIHKVSIIPRGMALGLTQQLPLDEKHTYPRNYLMNNLAILFGGRVAEELVLGEMTTGAGNDIERATELARKMVCEWGMSEEMGPLTFGKKDHEIFLGKELSYPSDYSPATAVQIDGEIRRIVMENYDRAKEILTENIDKLHLLANTLLEKESVDGEEIERIVLREAEGAKVEEESAAVSSDHPHHQGEAGKEPHTPEDRDEEKKTKLAIPPLGLKSQEEGG
jgi:cell division protease FtsH